MTDPRRALLPKIFGPILGLLILVLLAVLIAIFYLRGPSDFSDNYRQSSRDQNGNLITTQSPLQRYQSIRGNRMAADLVTKMNKASNVSSKISITLSPTMEVNDLNENLKLKKKKR
ncbi:unnamed protein product, partial [Mesorhabditis belari]|uniref:Uncharacterized protein n=1 Tax=Mesorhabditis belari TaxID=2138241 RepID=A0AAF3EUT0_9BILA